MPRRRRAGNDDQGFATVEFIVAFPLVLLLVWIGFQLVFVFFANRVALAAAEEGARAARSYTGSAAAGDARAHKFLAELGSGVLVEPTVRAYRTPERAGVVVEGRAQQLVPGLSMVLQVHRAADGPVERFRGETRGFVNSEGSLGLNPRAVAPLG
jgi:Flp pilus assembly protein TadG